MPMVRFCAMVVLHKIKTKRKFIIANPRESSVWYVQCFQDILRHNRVSHGDLNFCAYGTKDPNAGNYYKKPTSLLHNFSDGTLDPIFKTCPTPPKRRFSNMKIVDGHAKGHGSRSKLSQIYPYNFCGKLADIWEST